MPSNFEINPCKAVLKNVGNSGYDINNINNLCYGVCNSYGQVYGSGVGKKCRDMCADMISRKKQELGTTDCYKRQPTPPLSWYQVPDYYPRLLKKIGDKQQAYEVCCNMCEGCQFPNECREKCKLNADAVDAADSGEGYKGYKGYKFNPKIMMKGGYNKVGPVPCYLIFIVITVIIVCLVCMFVKSDDR